MNLRCNLREENLNQKILFFFFSHKDATDTHPKIILIKKNMIIDEIIIIIT